MQGLQAAERQAKAEARWRRVWSQNRVLSNDLGFMGSRGYMQLSMFSHDDLGVIHPAICTQYNQLPAKSVAGWHSSVGQKHVRKAASKTLPAT